MTNRPAVDVYHGEAVRDDHRWLESEGEGWAREQDATARAWLAGLPHREAFRGLMSGLVQGPVRLDAYVTCGRRRFFREKRPGAEQPVLCVLEGDAVRDLVDPNALAADGTTSLDWWYASPAGRYVALGLTSGGTERATLRVIDVETGRLLPDALEPGWYPAIGWLPDEGGFYYTRQGAPERDAFECAVRFHALGAAHDALVFDAGGEPGRFCWAWVSRSGRYVGIVSGSSNTLDTLHVLDRASGEPARLVARLASGRIFDGHVHGDHVVLVVTDGAPRGRVVEVDLARPEPSAWREVVPQSEHPIQNAIPVGEWLAVETLRGGASHLEVVRFADLARHEVPLPGRGNVGALSRLMFGVWIAPGDGPRFSFTYQSYTHPVRVLGYDPETRRLEELYLPEASATDDRFRVEQTWATSRDGTAIPVVRIALAGQQGPGPLLLAAYGGSALPSPPRFFARDVAWVLAGGQVAWALVRGGGDFGEAWHAAALRARRQTAFDDFFAAAEHLVATERTTPAQLGILGTSNGGLLVAACLTQRPGFCAAAIARVPLTDMLRFEQHPQGQVFTEEYGSVANSDEDAALRRYSPLHAVASGTRYPPTLLTTAAADRRVAPWHAFKLTAALQAAHPDNQALLRYEQQAGHGFGRPAGQLAAEDLDVLAFLAASLGLTPSGC